MTLTWRDATVADAEKLGRIGRDSFVETFGHLYSPTNLALFLKNHDTVNWLRELADPAFAVRLAMDDDDVAGYAKVGPPKLPFAIDDASAIELKQFYALSKWHGSGLAQEMMAWVLDEARRRGASDLYLSVFTDNHRARRFYERFGFIGIGRYDFMVGDHADEDIVMKCRL